MSGRRRGIALVLVLLSLSVVGVAAAAVVILSSRTLWMSRSSNEREQALLAAETGLYLTLDTLMQNPDYGGIANVTRLEPIGATYSSTVTEGPRTAPNGTVVPEGLHYVLATGTYRDQTRRVGQMIELTTSDFTDAAFAAREIDLRQNTKVDSWNSNQGVYPAGNNRQGNVATNSDNREAIKLTGDTHVYGDAIVGPRGNPNEVIQLGQGSRIHGDKKKLRKERELQPVVLPADPSMEPTLVFHAADDTRPPGVYGDTTINGVELKLTSGVYVFKSLRLRNGGAIVVPPNTVDPVYVYVDEDFDMKGGSVVNKTTKASLMRILADNGAVTLDDKKTRGYFVVYAPNSRVEVEEDAHLYGAVVGQHVKVKHGANLTYDIALRGIQGMTADLDYVSRQDF